MLSFSFAVLCYSEYFFFLLETNVCGGTSVIWLIFVIRE